MINNVSTRVQSGNLYAYTKGNPVMWSDPSGMVATPNRENMWQHLMDGVREGFVESLESQMQGARESAMEAARNALGAGIVDGTRVRFDTLDEAAMAWGEMFGQLSIADRREWGAWLYRDEVGYYWGELIVGSARSLTGFWYDRGTDRTNAVGWIHTHGSNAGRVDLNFSAGDAAIIHAVYARYGVLIPAFLVNVHGEFFRMDPEITNLASQAELWAMNDDYQRWHGTRWDPERGFFHMYVLNRYVHMLGRLW